MKVISWNVENALRCLPALPTIVDELGSPEVLCLQELRIRGSDEQATGALTQALPGYCCHYSLPRDPRNVTFRGGRMYGVATFVQGSWRADVPDWDLEGRVVVVRGLVVTHLQGIVFGLPSFLFMLGMKTLSQGTALVTQGQLQPLVLPHPSHT